MTQQTADPPEPAPIGKCIRPDCGRLAKLTWFCEEHYLEKEALYGVYDLENDAHYATPEIRRRFRRRAVERLIRYVRFMAERSA